MHPWWCYLHVPETLVVASMLVTVIAYAMGDKLGRGVYLLIAGMLVQIFAVVVLFVPGVYEDPLTSAVLNIAGRACVGIIFSVCIFFGSKRVLVEFRSRKIGESLD